VCVAASRMLRIEFVRLIRRGSIFPVVKHPAYHQACHVKTRIFTRAFDQCRELQRRREMRKIAMILGLACACACQGAVVLVEGKCNVFGAGHAVAPDPSGGGAGVLPVMVSLAGFGAGDYVELNDVSGTVQPGFGFTPNTADGGTSASGTTDVRSWNGISGLIHSNRTMFLTGVFIGSGEPTDPSPARLDVTNANAQHTITPLLAQTFFMGDGRDSASVIQQFIIPAGATRLYFGFVDAFEFGNPSDLPGHYGDNSGVLSVGYNIVPSPASALVLLGLARGCRRRVTRR